MLSLPIAIPGVVAGVDVLGSGVELSDGRDVLDVSVVSMALVVSCLVVSCVVVSTHVGQSVTSLERLPAAPAASTPATLSVVAASQNGGDTSSSNASGTGATCASLLDSLRAA